MPMIEDVDIFKDSSRVLITLFEQLTVQQPFSKKQRRFPWAHGRGNR
jgi:hypothetical protein